MATPCRRIGLRKSATKSCSPLTPTPSTNILASTPNSRLPSGHEVCTPLNASKSHEHHAKTPLGGKKIDLNVVPQSSPGPNRSYKRQFLQDTSACSPNPTKVATSPIALSTPITKRTKQLHTSSTPSQSASPQTPVLETPIQSRFGRYRLSLSGQMRDKLSRKRLHFLKNSSFTSNLQRLINQEDEDESRTLPNACEAVTTPKSTKSFEKDFSVRSPSSSPNHITQTESLETLKALLETKQQQVLAMESHNVVIKEMQDSIEVWTSGFKNALEMLCASAEPPLDKNNVLMMLNISREDLGFDP